jgi:hypothetical protein
LTNVGEMGFSCWQFQQTSKSSSTNSAQAGHFHIMGGAAFRPRSKISCHSLNTYHTFVRFLCGRESAMLAQQSSRAVARFCVHFPAKVTTSTVQTLESSFPVRACPDCADLRPALQTPWLLTVSIHGSGSNYVRARLRRVYSCELELIPGGTTQFTRVCILTPKPVAN